MRGIFASENPVQPGFGAGPRFAAAPEQYLLHIKRCVGRRKRNVILINIAGTNGMPKRVRGS